MKSNNFFLCVLMALCGALAVWNTELFKPTAVQASSNELPQFNFTPVGKFNLNVDMDNGTATVESNLRIAEANVEVNHPTKVVEQEVPKYIKVPVYETKTEYLTKVVTFPLPTPKLHISDISIPNRVE